MVATNLSDAIRITHHDPLGRRSLFLTVLDDDAEGNTLDVPEVIDVVGFVLQDADGRTSSEMSFEAGTLCSSVADALTREFQARLRTDAHLRKWLIAETATAAFGGARGK